MTPEQIAAELYPYSKEDHIINEVWTSDIIQYQRASYLAGCNDTLANCPQWIKATEKAMPENELVFIKTQGAIGTGYFTDGVFYGQTRKGGAFYNLTATDISSIEWLSELSTMNIK